MTVETLMRSFAGPREGTWKYLIVEDVAYARPNQPDSTSVRVFGRVMRVGEKLSIELSKKAIKPSDGTIRHTASHLSYNLVASLAALLADTAHKYPNGEFPNHWINLEAPIYDELRECLC